MGAAVMGVSASTGVAAASAAPVKEAGSSLVYPLVAIWSLHYSGATIQAAAGGSSVGIADAAQPSVDIGASDAPETPAQYGQNHGQVVEIPWALSATTAAYNIPGVNANGLKLSGKVLAEIYTGRIKSWNNSTIIRANPHYKKALQRAGKITPVFRSDGSGDSYAFQRFLTFGSAHAWSKGYSVSFPGPSNGVGENGNAGVAGEVKKVRGSIGYISGYYALTQHVKVAAVENAAGKYVLPNPSAILAASKSASHISGQGPGFTGLPITYPSRKFSTAYPISTYTYALINKNGHNLGAVKSFLSWVINSNGGQRYGFNTDFIQLPGGVRAADQGLINSL
ncbi:MAG: phosphate ABC transporter substrate-binding protein PstS [Solirubrobacterales bacterium]|nr:phosphate ABC transporter substrate-binding protein PstS [Solirubrobacterales bacterium]